MTIRVPRYRCMNPECTRRTYSILPPRLVRYCRFFWSDLLVVNQSLAAGRSAYWLARHVWRVGRGVIVRAAALLQGMTVWVRQLHQELTDGAAGRSLGLMVKLAAHKLGRVELVERWYRHHYPRGRL